MSETSVDAARLLVPALAHLTEALSPDAELLVRGATGLLLVPITALLLATGSSSAAQEGSTAPARTEACADDNGGITLPPGFCASVFADNIGHARHLVVAPNGVVYVNTWSGRYYRNDTPPPGGFLVALQDTNGDGRADVNIRFGETREQGSADGWAAG